MADKSNVAPVIIKRKKVIAGDGHHGGAWKIAYADFVTAMMAFFLLMWLINATTEQQRLGIAEFFSPTVPLNKVSGGGNAMFGGDSVLEENILALNGVGGLPTALKGQPEPVEFKPANGEGSEGADEFEELEDMLIGGGGESFLADNLMKHVVTRLTDEGLVIEIFDSETERLFVPNTGQPMPILLDLADVLVDVANMVTNRVAVEGHVRSELITVRENNTWPLSAIRADQMRAILERRGLAAERVARVTGHADKEQVSAKPRDLRNNRIEIILLRSDR